MTCSFCLNLLHRALGEHAAFVQHRDAAARCARRSPCRARRRSACTCRQATRTARRCAASPRRSCRRPARRAAAAAAPASAACRSPATASGRATAAPPAARPPAAAGSSPASSRCGRAPPRRGARAASAHTRLSAFIASSRFSNTECCSNTVGFWNLRPMPRAGDFRLGEPREVDGLAEECGAGVGPRLAGDHIHHRRLAGAVGPDDAAQLAGVDQSATGCSAP